MYNISLIGIVIMNLLLYNDYILIQIYNKKELYPSSEEWPHNES